MGVEPLVIVPVTIDRPSHGHEAPLRNSHKGIRVTEGHKSH